MKNQTFVGPMHPVTTPTLNLFTQKEDVPKLPVGNQSRINSVYEVKRCDCGGMKTYNSSNPIHHSYWCSLISK